MTIEFSPNTTAEPTTEYREGQAAYGEGTKECPYLSGSEQGNQRYRRWVGWYDAQTEDHLGKKAVEAGGDDEPNDQKE